MRPYTLGLVPSVIWYGLLVSLASVIGGQSSQLIYQYATLMIPNKVKQVSVALSFLFGLSGKTGGWSDHLKAQHCSNAAFSALE